MLNCLVKICIFISWINEVAVENSIKMIISRQFNCNDKRVIGKRDISKIFTKIHEDLSSFRRI